MLGIVYWHLWDCNHKVEIEHFQGFIEKAHMFQDLSKPTVIVLLCHDKVVTLHISLPFYIEIMLRTVLCPGIGLEQWNASSVFPKPHR